MYPGVRACAFNRFVWWNLNQVGKDVRFGPLSGPCDLIMFAQQATKANVHERILQI